MRFSALLLFALAAPLPAQEPKKGKDPVGVIKTFAGHDGPVRGVDFSADGKRLYSSGDDKTIRMWDLVNEKKSAVLAKQLPQPAHWIAHLEKAGPTAKQFVTDGGAAADTLSLWDGGTGRIVRTYTGIPNGVKSVCLSADNKYLCCGSVNSKVLVWEVATGRGIASLDARTGHVQAVAFSPDGKMVVSTADDDGGLRMWEVATGKQVWRDKPKDKRPTVTCLKFTPDGKKVVCGTQDHLIRIVDWNGKEEPVVLKGHTAQVHSLDINKDGSLLATACEDRTVRVWDLGNNKELHKFEHDGEVFRVKFSPDGKRLASASKDETVKLWGLGKE